MTVIAWDGTTLAADRRGCLAGCHIHITKIFRIGDSLVGFSGSATHFGRYRAWFESDRDPVKYPAQSEDELLYSLVIHRSGKIERFESTGWPVIVEEEFFAAGSGRDFALATLALGYSAVRAVEIASQLCSECGNGIDTLTFEPVV